MPPHGGTLSSPSPRRPDLKSVAGRQNLMYPLSWDTRFRTDRRGHFKFHRDFWSIRDSGVISWGQRSSHSPPRCGFRQSVRLATIMGDACTSFLENMTDRVRRHNGLAQIASVPCASFECSGNNNAYSESHPNRERARFFIRCCRKYRLVRSC